MEDQMKLSKIINVEGSVGTVDLTSDMDDEMESQPAMFSTKGSPRVPKTFRENPRGPRCEESRKRADNLMIMDRDISCHTLENDGVVESGISSTWRHGLAFLWQKHFSWLDVAKTKKN